MCILHFLSEKVCCQNYHKKFLCQLKMRFHSAKKFICEDGSFWSKLLEVCEINAFRLCKKLCIVLITLPIKASSYFYCKPIEN